MASPVVTFDAGQTLVDLDLDFLASRLGERGLSVEVGALEAAAPAAWQLYDRLVEAGAQHPWHAFIDALLAGAGVSDREPLVQWLYEQQATRNLWRRPIAPMIELVRELRARGVLTAVISNSEGHLVSLLTEIGLASLFDAIIDSHRVGIAKPAPEIFAITLERLGIANPELIIHVGDSWSADVEGALGVGWNAIWYRSRSGKPEHHPRVPVATDAAQTRAALATLGLRL
jgi:HAD superfamily hydrolase (TIGR01509 family)